MRNLVGADMSRIGKLPIKIPNGVEVKIGEDSIEVKGPKGQLSTPKSPILNYTMDGDQLIITRKNDNRESRCQHGLRRTLAANCIEGVTKGFSKALEVIGVGYRAAVKGDMIELLVGYSHPVIVDLPPGIKATVDGQVLTLNGIDKELVGEMAAKIRRIRKPEPYKGKGIKYVNEVIRRIFAAISATRIWPCTRK